MSIEIDIFYKKNEEIENNIYIYIYILASLGTIRAHRVEVETSCAPNLIGEGGWDLSSYYLTKQIETQFNAKILIQIKCQVSTKNIS